MKFFLFIILIILPFSVYAQTQPRTEWDCNPSHLEFISKNLQTIANMLPEETQNDNLEITSNAFSNLQKYCKRNKRTLQTPFFLNHIVDQYFRYLDWIQTNNYYWPLYSESKQRRKYLNQIAENNFRWINPENIQNKFKNQYIPLIRKYRNFCNTLDKINNFIETKKASLENTNYNWKYKEKCQKLTDIILAKETYLLHQIILKTYYSTFDYNQFKYFKAYASQLNDLYNIFTIALWDFYYLVNRFIKVTDANTK